ncbi:MAG: Reversal of tor2 lethality [Chrysothrix sp. TS-e1954]|nr:MAG: Reversal of tor2 lethality [Chrysothrix sp. TS-e1954]
MSPSRRWVASTVAALLFTSCVTQEQSYDPKLEGTWSTKSAKVLTGPGFYDPVSEKLIEPALTGISYSFTKDGFYEEAYYRAISNPTKPTCPSSILQWQHGRYSILPNSSIQLKPFPPDGRQLLSDPCQGTASIYTKYHQAELILKYEALLDTYNDMQRLNLYAWDGTPVNPMWLAFRPPEMLPTTTLAPKETGTVSGSRSDATATTGARSKREAEGWHIKTPRSLDPTRRGGPRSTWHGLRWVDVWFWGGIGLTGAGGILFFCF